jgi:hypothetical protein
LAGTAYLAEPGAAAPAEAATREPVLAPGAESVGEGLLVAEALGVGVAVRLGVDVAVGDGDADGTGAGAASAETGSARRCTTRATTAGLPDDR